jgi:hypothetical protein
VLRLATFVGLLVTTTACGYSPHPSGLKAGHEDLVRSAATCLKARGISFSQLTSMLTVTDPRRPEVKGVLLAYASESVAQKALARDPGPRDAPNTRRGVIVYLGTADKRFNAEVLSCVPAS